MGTSQTASGTAAKGGTKPRITAHPAFPMVVAMWFAALLGLGAIILPNAMIEGLLTATGIAKLIPAAAPPLGFTAHAAIALGAGVLGAWLGLAVARKVARPAPDIVRRRSFARAATTLSSPKRREPLNALEDLGSDSFDTVANFASARRRALATGAANSGEGDGRRSDFLKVAPLPGEDDGHGLPHADDPFDLTECAEFTEVTDHDPQFAAPPFEAENEDTEMSGTQDFATFEIPGETALPDAAPQIQDFAATAEPLPFSPPSMARKAAPDADELAPAQELAASAGSLDDLGLVQLVERLGATLEKHRMWAAQRAELAASAAQFPRAVQFPQAVVVNDVETGDIDMADPGDAAQAMASFFAEAADPEPEPAEPDPVMPARQEFISAPPTSSPAAPSSFKPFAGLGRLEEPDDGENDDEYDDIAASFALPLGSARVPVSLAPLRDDGAAEQPEQQFASTEESEAPYPSLLAVKNPFRDNRPEFVRIETPEPAATQAAVLFPHEEPQLAAVPAGGAGRSFDRPDNAANNAAANLDEAGPFAGFTSAMPAATSDENDRILREALMNLQRFGKSG